SCTLASVTSYCRINLRDRLSFTRFLRLATRCAAAMPDHLRRNRRLVDEEEARRIKPGLLGLQPRTRRSDIRTILFGGVQSSF
ncbi:MAG: hypothetical protein M3O41_02860, partial [Pseudomonadota bacterium]|nr:hypothetical protein [Pseudomonadota bacterium]